MLNLIVSYIIKWCLQKIEHAIKGWHSLFHWSLFCIFGLNKLLLIQLIWQTCLVIQWYNLSFNLFHSSCAFKNCTDFLSSIGRNKDFQKRLVIYGFIHVKTSQCVVFDKHMRNKPSQMFRNMWNICQ